jgi:murein DD-endopeptidase MepM/ murein hydrolase activator NlpD
MWNRSSNSGDGTMTLSEVFRHETVTYGAMRTSTTLRRRALAGSALAIAIALSAAPASAHDANRATVSDDATTALDAIACPIAGDAEFSDSWGDRRSGGRRHEGVDMAADRGTPVVAVLAGFAEFKNTSAGGKSIWLTTPNGDKFFYAHLDDWEGESREVARGDVVGYVGSTGNAGGPHLHFEVRPGGRAVNPYPPTFAACERKVDSDPGPAVGVGPGVMLGLLMAR